MANITALEEDFTGPSVGTAVSTSNTIFDDVTGTGTSVFSTGVFGPAGTRSMDVTTSSNFKTHVMDVTPIPLLWFSFDLKITTALNAACTIFQANDATDTNKILDIRQAASARQLSLRNVNTAVWTSGTLGTGNYRLYVYMKVDSTKRIRCVLYSLDATTGVETLVDDSGSIVSSTSATTVGLLRIGAISSASGAISIGRLRGDDAVQPNPPQEHTRTVGPDTLALTDTVALERSIVVADNMSMTDEVFTDLQRLEGWIYGKEVRIGG